MKWISVKDRLPEKSGLVIVYKHMAIVTIENFIADDWNKFFGHWADKITHWMPLPEPPEEVEG